MRKLNLEVTSTNVDNMSLENLYSFYGLTENNDFDKYENDYVTENFRFSCAGSKETIREKVNLFKCIIRTMHKAYLKEMNLQSPIFHITNIKAKPTPYKTIVMDVRVENIKGAFATVVNCAGPDKHQFHASDLWVRANSTADVWKSLYDHDDSKVVQQEEPFEWIDEKCAIKWLDKVRDARCIAKNCIRTVGEPSEESKEELKEIMAR